MTFAPVNARRVHSARHRQASERAQRVQACSLLRVAVPEPVHALSSTRGAENERCILAARCAISVMGGRRAARCGAATSPAPTPAAACCPEHSIPATEVSPAVRRRGGLVLAAGPGTWGLKSPNGAGLPSPIDRPTTRAPLGPRYSIPFRAVSRAPSGDSPRALFYAYRFRVATACMCSRVDDGAPALGSKSGSGRVLLWTPLT